MGLDSSLPSFQKNIPIYLYLILFETLVNHKDEYTKLYLTNPLRTLRFLISFASNTIKSSGFWKDQVNIFKTAITHRIFLIAQQI